MSINELLNYLAEQEVKLWVEKDRLHFRARAEVITPDLRQELMEHKADLIKLLHARDQGISSGYTPIKPVARIMESIPLSFAQQRLWFLDQLAPQNPVYNVPLAFRLAGPLNLYALERSVQEIVLRHESLRTIFAVHDGQPQQVILPPTALPECFLRVVDLLALPSEQRAASSRDIAQQEALHPFDLSCNLLLRASLLRIEEQEHVLLLTLHHIACDGWSGGVINHELGLFYAAFASEVPFPLPALPVQYADFACWQRERLQGAVLEQLLSYWREQLADLPVLNLPTDFARPSVETYRGTSLTRQIAPHLLSRLERASKKEGVTLFMTLLAAFQVLLMHFCGQEDIVVGVPIADRHQEELKGLIGLFVNTLVLRTRLSGNPSFRELLQRVREMTLSAYSHQDLPFERLVEALQPERRLAYNPLCQVLFQLHDVSQHLPALAGITVEEYSTRGQTAKFDLSLFCSEEEEALSCQWEYNTDLFAPATIECMHLHFQQILECLTANLEQRVYYLDLLTPAEHRQMLVEWNRSENAPLSEQTIAACFDAQVERTPDAIALVCQDQQYSYQDLQTRSNRLAHHLILEGVRPETRVGVCLPRSGEMVIALLAVLKAGGAYVPLDPAYPPERLNFLLADSQARFVLTRTPLRSCLSSLLSPIQVLCLDEVNLEPVTPAHAPISGCVGEHLAYVIYTSGSTGVPKGVSLTHRNALVLLAWARSFLAPYETNNVLASTSICFDLSVFELFGTLSWGGTVVLVEDLFQLGDLSQAERVTLVNTVPSVLAAYLRLHALPASVRTVNLAGEQLSLPLVEQLYASPSIQHVHNLYGPSEDTTYSLGMRLKREARVVPIGRPLGSRRAYVLNRWEQPVPIGVVGELYLAGEGLARGYWQRADLTAERFVPDPWSDRPGGRLYRTGDLVRYLEDGALEYVGRGDGQVKLRGYRIESGEVEVALRQHPHVGEAAVTVWGEAEEARLIGYVVAKSREAKEGSESLGNMIQHWLHERLPGYMIPSRIVELDALPLLPNGKLDRRALPVQESREHQGLAAGLMSPGTPIEEILVEIWKQVLQISQVGTQENFFALGGHSLLATRVVARVQTILQKSVPVRALFEYPTIAALARFIETMQLGAGSRPALRPRSQQTILSLSFAQQRLWFLDQLVPESPFYNMPLAFHLEGPAQLAGLEHSLQKMVQRHETLRTVFVIHQDQPKQAIMPLSELPERLLPLVDLEALTPLEQERICQELATQEALRPFHLNTDLVLRGCVLRLGKQEHLLLLTLHHIACDGWSLGVLIRELGVFYRAFVAGEHSPLPPLPAQYADFACWQRDWLQGEVLEQQLAYWQRQLAGLPVLSLPTDFMRPQIETFRGAYIAQRLPASLVTQLKKLSQQEEVTLFMILLAAFQVLLLRYSAQEDIVVGTPVANRTQQELEGLIGFFVNTLVLRTDLSGNPTFHELLARVREVTLGAYAHQDLPFERLVEALQPERNLAYNPLCQVVFQLQNTPQQSLTLPGLAVTHRWEDNQTAKLDLAVFCVEEQGQLACRWEYSTELFTAATIERMSQHFQTLLTALLADPAQRIQHLNLLTKSERELILFEWNPSPTLTQRTVVDCFEAQVQRQPEAIALVFQEQQFTYDVLNRRANQLARFLRRLGVGPEVLVGVGLERSLDLVVALLGIFKAGGAYLPLDPAYPPQRLAFLLQDGQVSLLLTHNSLQEQFDTGETQVLLLDVDWPLINEEPASDPRNNVQPDDLAYVIYTSGSTGLPKGVMVPHRGLYNLAQAQESTFAMEKNNHVLQFASSSFDASIWEIMMTLSWGASLYLAPRASLVLGSSLEQILQTCAISLAAFPPSTLATLDPERVPELRMVLSFGEECSASLAGRWSRNRAFFNGYGPTECTICTTLTDQYRHTDRLTIGRPVSNLQIYILDQYLHMAPIGVPGELCIGGVGLARGYLHHPELTARRFIAHPFSTQAGARLYKSGDMARYRPDGSIEFLGRVDQQVKLRGFRVEMGEIEAALAEHPLVQEAVVTLHQEQDDKRLVAYVVPAARAGQAEETFVQRQEQVARWQELYAQSYQELEVGSDPTFNIRGWNSSYTGQPISEGEMRSWLEDTLSSIRRLHAGRVLEIGCGTGLLLFPLAPDCTRYDASDFSAQSLAYVRKVMERDPARYSAVQLWQREADVFEEWPERSYNLVIINSVVQYFPDVSYLLRVLQGALRLLAPGGTLFLGDVRSLPLQDYFHLAVLLAQGSEGANRQQVRQRVQRESQLEEELLVDPALFVALGQSEGRICRVRVLPKMSGYSNELTQFRYQVLIQVDEQEDEKLAVAESIPSLTWQEWQTSYKSLAQLRETLQREQPIALGLSRIPNARLSHVREAHRWLWQEQEPAEQTLGALRQRTEVVERQGIDPVDIRQTCAELGYQLQVSWARQAEEGCYDAILIHTRKGAEISDQQITSSFPLPGGQTAPSWQTYTNRPLEGQWMRHLVPLLRQHLQERLPDYMVPAHLLVLERMPLTPNGKVDRRVLPIPQGEARLGLKEVYVSPRTAVERQLAQIWTRVLGLPKIGVHDDFFALGGHSLLATQVMARVQTTWQVNVPLRTLFEHPTVERLSRALVDYERMPGQIETMARLHEEIDQMSPEEIRTFLQEKD